jgi:dipeptide/tripeptide permease
LLPVGPFAISAAAREGLRETQGAARDVRDVLRLLPIFAVLPVFWCVFDSTGSVWLLQRLDMAMCLGLLCLEPDMLGFLNPLLIIILIPVFDQLLMPCLERCATDAAGRRSWLYPTPLRKMAVGMQFGALAFVISGALQAGVVARGPGALNQWLQLPQFLLITVAEILVSITGLEFAYSQSPPDMKSTVLALYFLCISIGDMLTAVLYSGMSNSGLDMTAILFVFAALTSAAGIIFIVLAAMYTEKPPRGPGKGDEEEPGEKAAGRKEVVEGEAEEPTAGTTTAAAPPPASADGAAAADVATGSAASPASADAAVI